ncbi:long-chain-fatty-acid-CoA ligase [Thraustotheca clavata]|uniref:Long-chain-fatty-acid--CoA ligase n=1 Tax=Thraustotheca clavata TaxID=74557 RepID=A0A1W0AB90_9STRA|nr:long-chain-fatty-acid-CoA ligase [Thraustotheca clavata]
MGSSESVPTRVFSHEIPGTTMPGYGGIRVSADSLPFPDELANLWTNFKVGLSTSANEQYLGTRSRDTNGKAGPYEWMTYQEAHDRAARIATGLKNHLKMARQENLGIFAKNRAEWVLTEMASNRMGYVLVPLYDTLGPDVIPYILNHTTMRVLVCSGDLISNVLNVKHKCPDLEYIVSMDPSISARLRADAESKGVQILTLHELESVPDATVPEEPAKASEVATICYTSGTTGDPKGAILTQRNLAATAYLAIQRLNADPSYTHLSYLPLPHVFERMVLATVTRVGASIGFYQGDVLHLMDDMAELKPVLFVSVPRLFNRVYDKIMQGVNASGGFKKMLFDYAYETKRQGLASGSKTHALWDTLVFEKLRAVLGGRVKLIISGSAPLAANVKEFMKIAFSCDVEEGYGLTETSAGLTISIPDIPTGAHVGMPLPNVQVRLADVPEMNYTSLDKPCPRGEVCVRGPNVFVGYYKDKEKTDECLTEDGWFCTGDIGCWNPDGTLSLIDRKKNIFKLSQGEYIAAEKIENIYAKSPFVAQIFLYGDSLQSCVVAIIVPDPEAVQAWAASKSISDGSNLDAMVKRADLKAAILSSMNEMAKEGKLNGFECVKDITLHAEVFSVDNGLVTPTFKLKRPQLKERFKNEVSAMYAALK